MYYEINVSKKNTKTGRYEHLFATAERSIRSMAELKRVWREISAKFSGEEYHLSVTRIETLGQTVNIERI